MKKTKTGLIAALAMLAIGPAGAQDPAQVKRGQAIYEQWCISCHGAGPGHPGTQALEFRYQGALPAALAERPGLTPELVAVFVRNGISIMPFFRKTEISDAELADLGAYLARETTSAEVRPEGGHGLRIVPDERSSRTTVD